MYGGRIGACPSMKSRFKIHSGWCINTYMTFSIVASNPSTKELCVATSTGLVAVGNLVPSILPNVGAICVQAMVKPSYRETILDLMKKGSSNKSAINNVLKNDKKKEHRQIIVVNAKGQTYVFSGQRMVNICDSCMENNFAIAGNMLASTSVISSMKTAFLNNLNVFFPKRLLLSFKKGENWYLGYCFFLQVLITPKYFGDP